MRNTNEANLLKAIKMAKHHRALKVCGLGGGGGLAEVKHYVFAILIWRDRREGCPAFRYNAFEWR
jgi:hypothetical protein